MALTPKESIITVLDKLNTVERLTAGSTAELLELEGALRDEARMRAAELFLSAVNNIRGSKILNEDEINKIYRLPNPAFHTALSEMGISEDEYNSYEIESLDIPPDKEDPVAIIWMHKTNFVAGGIRKKIASRLN